MDEPQVLDYREMTDEQKATLEHNVKGCTEMLDALIYTVVDHREDCDCPNELCAGTDNYDVRAKLKPAQEHMLLTMALSRLADQVIVRELDEQLEQR